MTRSPVDRARYNRKYDAEHEPVRRSRATTWSYTKSVPIFSGRDDDDDRWEWVNSARPWLTPLDHGAGCDSTSGALNRVVFELGVDRTKRVSKTKKNRPLSYLWRPTGVCAGPGEIVRP